MSHCCYCTINDGEGRRDKIWTNAIDFSCRGIKIQLNVRHVPFPRPTTYRGTVAMLICGLWRWLVGPLKSTGISAQSQSYNNVPWNSSHGG